MRRLIVQASVMLVMLATLFFASSAEAANDIRKLMMPGPLSNVHSKLEDDCSNCHIVLKKEAQSNLCLNCHKDVQKDVNAKKGFHGRSLIVGKSECFACHTEHEGLDHKLIQLEPIIFNHSETEFALQGGHKTVACEKCHVAGKKFREAPHTCFACHANSQPHKTNLGEKCETCHVVDGWKKVATFDHEKTKFPLRGGHTKATCLACHVGEIYKGLPTTCNNCHALQDVHGGKFGAECQDCHTVEAWKGAKFDHTKQTKFPLLGAHARAQCADCHGSNIRSKLEMTCISCHKGQDVHKGQLGDSCQDCHGSSSWKQDVKFDHGLTKFPLTGQHVAVACEACHISKAFQGAPITCIACHAKDDTHEGRFTANCASCHSALDWKRVNFDHSRDTKYPLTGSHASVGCYACHGTKNVKQVTAPTTCYACHKAQDVHHGAFGADCAKCHSTGTFKSAIISK
jgi:Class III cytochrome C family